MNIINSARSLGCDVCEVTIDGEAGLFYCSTSAYRAAYDTGPVAFRDGGDDPMLVLRHSSIDLDTLQPPTLPDGPIWAICYAPGQGLDDSHIHGLIAAPSAAEALKRDARCECPVRQSGRYRTMNRWIQLHAVPWTMPQFCELCGMKMRSAEHGTGRCEYHAANINCEVIA
jgi:hypothetical protein